MTGKTIEFISVHLLELLFVVNLMVILVEGELLLILFFTMENLKMSYLIGTEDPLLE